MGCGGNGCLSDWPAARHEIVMTIVLFSVAALTGGSWRTKRGYRGIGAQGEETGRAEGEGRALGGGPGPQPLQPGLCTPRAARGRAPCPPAWLWPLGPGLAHGA